VNRRAARLIRDGGDGRQLWVAGGCGRQAFAGGGRLRMAGGYGWQAVAGGGWMRVAVGCGRWVDTGGRQLRGFRFREEGSGETWSGGATDDEASVFWGIAR